MSGTGKDVQDRRYARVTTEIRAHARALDAGDAAEALRRELVSAPSFWAPTDEGTLRDLAVQAGTPQAALARSVLEVSEALARLRSELLLPHPEALDVTLVGVSGSGGRISSTVPFEPGSLLELWLRADPSGAPPMRALVSIVHSDPVACSAGFRFEAIHPADKDRLIRYTFSLQRRAIRAAQQRED